MKKNIQHEGPRFWLVLVESPKDLLNINDCYVEDQFLNVPFLICFITFSLL